MASSLRNRFLAQAVSTRMDLVLWNQQSRTLPSVLNTNRDIILIFWTRCRAWVRETLFIALKMPWTDKSIYVGHQSMRWLTRLTLGARCSRLWEPREPGSSLCEFHASTDTMTNFSTTRYMKRARLVTSNSLVFPDYLSMPNRVKNRTQSESHFIMWMVRKPSQSKKMMTSRQVLEKNWVKTSNWICKT